MIRGESRTRDDSEPHCTIIDVSCEPHWPTIDVCPPAGSATPAETGGECP